MLGFRSLMTMVAGLAIGLTAVVLPQRAQAVYGAADNAPAASLLIPYFEVDLSNTNGRNTLISVANSSATAVLGNAVVWSDQGVPLVSFMIYFTGYDIQTISVRDVLNGLLPRTSTDGQDPTDTISPQGPLSQDINFASCTGVLPYSAGAVTTYGSSLFTPADLRSMLIGGSPASVPGFCAGTNRGDNIARGYITVDTFNSCIPTAFPSDVVYPQLITNQNVLHGDFFLVNPSTQLMVGAPAVAVEANIGQPPAPGAYTFYSRNNGFNASDAREPLPTTWRAGVENGSSELLVWRDPKVNTGLRNCAVAPAYGSLPIGDARGTTAYGTDTEPYGITANTGVAPDVSQRIAVSATPLTGLPAADTKLGWLNLSFNHGIAQASGQPVADPAAAQSWVITLRRPEGSGLFNLAVPATAMDTGLQANHNHPLD